jgi:pyruvyltransferase
MLARKLVKVVRKLRWAFQSPGSIPVHWHVGRPNFGDDINPYFFHTLLSRPIHFSSRSESHVLGIGSVLKMANEKSLIAGSGLLESSFATQVKPEQVLAVRGECSAEVLGFRPKCLGDPGVLVSLLFPRERRPQFRLGFIPHHAQTDALRGCAPATDCLFIDPAWHPLRVIDAICSCERILSQSMHGLIFADSYGIPNAWLSPHESMIGGKYKFDDYYSTTRSPKQPIHRMRKEDWFTSESIDFFVSEYLYDRDEYRRDLASRIIDASPVPIAV